MLPFLRISGTSGSSPSSDCSPFPPPCTHLAEGSSGRGPPRLVSCSTWGPPRSSSTTRCSRGSAQSSSRFRYSPCSCWSKPSTPLLNAARCSFAVVSAAIVMTHHLSSYVFAFWLTALAILMVRRRARQTLPVFRLVVLFTYFVVILLMYIDVLTKAIFLIHQQTLETALTNIVAPEVTAGGGSGSNLGRTFTQIEIGWLIATLIGLFLLAFFI